MGTVAELLTWTQRQSIGCRSFSSLQAQPGMPIERGSASLCATCKRSGGKSDYEIVNLRNMDGLVGIFQSIAS